MQTFMQRLIKRFSDNIKFSLLNTGAVLLVLIWTSSSNAGSYVFAGSSNGVGVVTHSSKYTGTGGNINISVCINPASQNAAQMATPVQNIVNIFNNLIPTTDNLASDPSIPGGYFDFESVALHEVGHCLGLGHVNLASESGLGGANQNYTTTTKGSNGVFNIGAGADGIIGSKDDVRGDDQNLHWFNDFNNPFILQAGIDSTNYSRNPADLPAGHAYAANGDRTVSSLLGYGSTEAVMQQGTFNNEAQRTLTADDVATLFYAMTGLDEITGNSDDYTFNLVYGGLANGCDINLTFQDTNSFAYCSTGGQFLNSQHIQITSANVVFGNVYNWYFNSTPNVAPAADLSVTVNDSADPVTKSAGFSYSITVNNTGPGSATGLQIQNNLPAGVNFNNATGSGWSCSEAGGLVTCNRSSLNSGSSSVITVNVTAPSSIGSITNNVSVSSTSTDPVSGNNSSSENTLIAQSGIWADDTVPAGATQAGVWDWVNNSPTPFSGSLAHRSELASGIHQHYFYNASDTLAVNTNDVLYTYVYLDPVNPPREIMLQWNDGSGWERRAYWGENLIPWGINGTNSRRYMGALPATGQWVKLEVPARLVGLEGKTIKGMAFTLYDGRATWDNSGVSAGSNIPWIEDAVPTGGTQAGVWNWINSSPTPNSGSLAHRSTLASGRHQHYFYNASQPMIVKAGDVLYTYVYLDPANPPREIMLQWNDGSGWERRAYWGENLIPWGVNGTNSRRYIGALPATGQWIRLEIPASQVGLEGKEVSGMAFTLYDGRATWDNSGVSAGSNVPWVEDTVPSGGIQSGVWNWINSSPTPNSGSLAHRSTLASGRHQHYFYNASQPMIVKAGDVLYTYVYLDPANPPREIMLQWNDGSGWERRAYWGENLIPWGVNGTNSRRYIGTLPATGQWIRLEIPANQVGLEGKSVSGMAFTLFDGRATWDNSGVTTTNSAWVEDSVPIGGTQAGVWNWIDNNPAPNSGNLAHRSTLASGRHQHYFYNATYTMRVNGGDKLYTYVYLDPANPPREIMLQWNDGSGWERRAYWGDNLIPWGTNGTNSRRYMGVLPATGQWVKLTVPASQVGLEGKTVRGMAFTLYDGRATWDNSGS